MTRGDLGPDSLPRESPPRLRSLELTIGPADDLIAASPPLLALLGWSGPPPAKARALLDRAPAELAAPLARALDGGAGDPSPAGSGAGTGAGPFLVERCATPGGDGKRIRLREEAGPLGEPELAALRIPPAISLWGASVAHQIHNLDLVLLSALHVLDGGGADTATPAARTQALRIGQTALRRSAGLLAAFAGLADLEGGDERVDAGEFLGWIETLTAPCARQSDARLTIDRGAVEGIGIDRRPSARAAAVLLAGAIELLGRERHLALHALPASAGVRLEMRLEGYPAEELGRIGEELALRLKLLLPPPPDSDSLAAAESAAEGGATAAGGWVRLPGQSDGKSGLARPRRSA